MLRYFNRVHLLPYVSEEADGMEEQRHARGHREKGVRAQASEHHPAVLGPLSPGRNLYSRSLHCRLQSLKLGVGPELEPSRQNHPEQPLPELQML